MEITLKYSSTRREVWDWYWRMWRKKLWMYHAFFLAVFLAGIGASFAENPPNIRGAIVFLIYAVILFTLFITAPQILYKSQERTLIVNDKGIETTIGKQKGSRNWKQVYAIENTPELITIIIGKTQNSLLIPRRAFASEAERSKFLSAIEMLHSKANE